MDDSTNNEDNEMNKFIRAIRYIHRKVAMWREW
jgi:hypothetical protein